MYSLSNQAWLNDQLGMPLEVSEWTYCLYMMNNTLSQRARNGWWQRWAW